MNILLRQTPKIKSFSSFYFRVIVDCREIFQPGQLAVAVGRCRSLAGLKIINFSEDAVIPQPTMVTDFLKKETVPFEEDLSCCKTVR